MHLNFHISFTLLIFQRGNCNTLLRKFKQSASPKIKIERYEPTNASSYKSMQVHEGRFEKQLIHILQLSFFTLYASINVQGLYDANSWGIFS